MTTSTVSVARDASQALRASTSTDVPGLIQGAFGHIRAREYEAARPIVARAHALAPHSGVAAHARLHLDAESGTIDEGADFGLAFLTEHDPFDGINVHNAWHLAALLLETGRPSAAVDWHARVVTPSVAEAPVTFHGAAALLWRLEVYGYGWTGGAALPWEALRAARLALSGPTGESADLEDIARAMVFVATGDDRGLAGLIEGLHAADGARRPKIGIVAEVVRGLRAWWQGDHDGAVDVLGPICHALVRLSPIPEQRTPIEDTLIEAQLRTGRFAAAEMRLRERLAGQPRPLPRDLFWLGQALHGQGRREEAAAALRAARDRWSGAESDSAEVAALDALAAA
jgi:hypothetical protein